ncbi:MAG: hypothetical protein IK999_10650 [Ruminococcus sp.]|nr:hypothetical protein [Ruminococcus sp.]
MKKFFAILSAFIILCFTFLPASAVTPSGGGANEPDWEGESYNGLLYDEMEFQTHPSLPENYINAFAVVSSSSTGLYSISENVPYLNGKIVNNRLLLSLPDGFSSDYYLCSVNYRSDGTTFVTSAHQNTFPSSFTINSNSCLYGFIPIKMEDGSYLSNPANSDGIFSLRGYMDSRYNFHYELDSNRTDTNFRVYWFLVAEKPSVGLGQEFDTSYLYNASVDIDETVNDITSDFASTVFGVEHSADAFASSTKFLLSESNGKYGTGDTQLSDLLSHALPFGKQNVLARPKSPLSTYTFSLTNYYYQMKRNGFPADISVVCAVYGNKYVDNQNKTGLLSVMYHHLPVNAILGTKPNQSLYDYKDTDSIWTGEDTENPLFSGSVEDITSLSDFAKFLARYWECQMSNLAIMLNNMTLNIREQIESINWHDVVGTGVGDYFRDLVFYLDHVFRTYELDTDYDLMSLVREITPLLENSGGFPELPDLTGAFAPVLASADLNPTGNFVPHLDGLFDSLGDGFELSLGGLSTQLTPFFGDTTLSLGGINTQLGDLNNKLTPYFGDTTLALGGLNTQLGDLNNKLTPFFGDTTLALGDINTQLGDLAVEVGEISTEINANVNTLMLPDIDELDTRISRTDNKLKEKFTFVNDVKDSFDEVRETIDESDESPPDWKFTWRRNNKVVEMYLVDWQGFQPYRIKIQHILLAVAYVLLAKYIFKTLPGCFGDGDK